MQYNYLGRSGLKVSELSFGSWITFGKQLRLRDIEKLMKKAFDAGINTFDTAEGYGNGLAENLMGEILGYFRREEIIVCTKLFLGGNGPNDRSLSRKHLMEGVNESLERLQVDTIDLLLCHFPDPDTPIEETVRAMDQIIRNGKALHWGISKWNATQIQTAFEVSKQLNCIPPTVGQAEYNILHHERVGKEFLPLYKKYSLGMMTWSPLASGVLTGKYSAGIPQGSRLATEEWPAVTRLAEHLDETTAVVKQLQPIADELQCSLAQLAIAWCLKNQNVNTVILGASNLEQLEHNLIASQVKEKLTAEIMQQINAI